MIKAVIFDGGGTIWDSMEVLYHSYGWAFKQLAICSEDDFPFTLSQCNRLRSLKDFNTESGISKALLGLYKSKENPEKVLSSDNPNRGLHEILARLEDGKFDNLSRNLEILLAKYLYEVFDDSKYPLCTGVKDAMSYLERKGISIALVSNRRRRSTLNILKAHGIDKMFSPIIAWEDQTKPKPSSEGIEKALQTLNISKNEAIFVGDSTVDIISAKLAGLRAFGVLSGMADEKILRSSGADIIIKDLSEFPKIISLQEGY